VKKAEEKKKRVRSGGLRPPEKKRKEKEAAKGRILKKPYFLFEKRKFFDCIAMSLWILGLKTR